MKYCPYCGAALVDGAVSFCAECGRALPVSGKKGEVREEPNQPGQQGEWNPRQENQYGKDAGRRQRRSSPPKKAGKEADVPRGEKTRRPEPPRRTNQQTEPPEIPESPTREDDYDGYYDDVLPADTGRLGEGLDRGLAKKVALIIGMVLLIVGACVMMMYLL